MATNAAPKTDAKDVEMNDVVGAIQEVDFKKYLSLLEKSASTNETRLGGRALRGIPSLRKKLNASLLRKLISQTLVAEDDKAIKTTLLSYLQSFESTNETATAPEHVKKPKPVIPEVESFLHLLVTIFLIDQNKKDLVNSNFSNLARQLQVLHCWLTEVFLMQPGEP
jgi:26S proteasome regulatory subunit N3